MNSDEITPLIITWNEEANLDRCLERLKWARRIVVVDSGSTDATKQIAAKYSNVDLIERRFDSFARQCNFGLDCIQTQWVLSMDADYIVPRNFCDRVSRLPLNVNGFRVAFRYCIFGKPLRSTLYPPRVSLYQANIAKYVDDGHGHRVEVQGEVISSGIVLDHDDRKPLARWLDSQRKYAMLEAEKMLTDPTSSGLPDKLRRMIWPAAPAAFVYTLFVKRLIFDGWPGLFYAAQRTYAELLLSLELMDRTRLRGGINERK